MNHIQYLEKQIDEKDKKDRQNKKIKSELDSLKNCLNCKKHDLIYEDEDHDIVFCCSEKDFYLKFESRPICDRWEATS